MAAIYLKPGTNLSDLRRRGFSLLELLVALTILAIALVPVAYFYSKSLQMVEEAGMRTRALMLAQERISEIEQMPYETIRTNVTPSAQQIKIYADSGDIDTAAADWYGYDYGQFQEWQAMFFYPLPLDYNPYQPQTQGYNNSPNAQHYIPNNPMGDLFTGHINFNNAGPELDYEYEPIGFYAEKIARRNAVLNGDIDGNAVTDLSDTRMNDRRTLPVVEPAVFDPITGTQDYLRSGYEQQVDNYAIYGRRTIIMDVVASPQDTDGGTPDQFAADDERDGGATAVNPYPIHKGPDNKFQLVSQHGSRGKLITVQVFWLPRKAAEAYIPWEDMNKVELKTFIAASNQDSNLNTNEGDLTRNDQMFISIP
jgi:prepilin-type N-terminal cleavage/methylation domain-containing protein